MYAVLLLLTLAGITLQTPLQQRAASTCTGQQYNNIPGFPNSKSACYPTNYYRTSDLGSTSPDDATARCQQQCTANGSRCKSVVAQVNKAADSNLYSGTCFFYAPGQVVSPRRCADTAYLLEGYMKDNTNDCFASSTAAASEYCSSHLGIPMSTVTATATPSPTTTTITSTSIPILTTTVIPSTLTSTSIVTTNPSVTVTATATTTPTTVVTTMIIATQTSVTTSITTSTSLTTSVSTPTAIVTQTSTSTVVSVITSTPATVTVAKRATMASTIPPPACVTSGTPASRFSAACSCLSISTSTTTTTTTLNPVTSTARTTTIAPTTATTTLSQVVTTVTSITTIPITVTQTATTTAAPVTSTVSTTSTTITTSTQVSVIRVTSVIVIGTVTTLTSSTATTTTTTTTTVVPTPELVTCNECDAPNVSGVDDGFRFNGNRAQVTCHEYDTAYDTSARPFYSEPLGPQANECDAIQQCANIAAAQYAFSFRVVHIYNAVSMQLDWTCDLGSQRYNPTSTATDECSVSYGSQYIYNRQ